jgi:hypothetical protein
MIGIEMKLNIPVHYQMVNPLQQGKQGQITLDIQITGSPALL